MQGEEHAAAGPDRPDRKTFPLQRELAETLKCDLHPTAARLFERLAARGITVPAYKNTTRIAAGLAGEGDIDLVLAEEDQAAWEDVMHSLGAVRTIPAPFHDNAVPSRQDWFLPLTDGAMLHCDVASPIMVGRKFCKAYRLSCGPELRDGMIPMVSAIDETRFALARLAFDLTPSLSKEPVLCPADLYLLLEDLLEPGDAHPVWLWQEAGQAATCRFTRQSTRLAIDRESLAAIRRAVRRANSASALAPLRDWAVHSAKRSANALVQRLGRLLPHGVIGKRRMREGTIIALIGPDGVGKSTQSAMLARHFGRKFGSTSIYLGSNDGSWMRWRKTLGLGRRRGSAEKRQGPSALPPQRGWLHANGSALWRLVIALQRKRAMDKAFGLARRGVIVIADRWPQMLAPGLLDGPSMRPPGKFRLAQMLWRIEQRIHRKISCRRPGLMIHLDCDFATSHRRKPGDITEEAFAARLALMQRMRAANEDIAVVDARQSRADVSADILRHAWQHLSAINAR